MVRVVCVCLGGGGEWRGPINRRGWFVEFHMTLLPSSLLESTDFHCTVHCTRVYVMQM